MPNLIARGSHSLPRQTLRWFLFAGLLFSVSASSVRAELIDGIAAQVGSKVILVSEVLQLVYNQEEQYRKQGADDTLIAQIRAEGLEQLIERALIAQIVERAGLQAKDAEVDQAIAKIADENGITVDQIQKTVEAQGMPYAAYRERIRHEVENAKVINSVVRSRVNVTDAQMRDLYDKYFANQPTGGTAYHLRQILVTSEQEGKDNKSLDVACNKVKHAAQRLRSGEDFGLVASQTSSVHPEAGGDIGWIHSDSLATWMQPLVEKMKAGELSEVIDLPFGCSILQLVEIQEYKPVSFEQAKPKLYEEIFSKQLEEEYGRWIEELRKRTYIERKGYFAEAARLRTPDQDEAASEQLIVPTETPPANTTEETKPASKP